MWVMLARNITISYHTEGLVNTEGIVGHADAGKTNRSECWNNFVFLLSCYSNKLGRFPVKKSQKVRKKIESCFLKFHAKNSMKIIKPCSLKGTLLDMMITY